MNDPVVSSPDFPDALRDPGVPGAVACRPMAERMRAVAAAAAGVIGARSREALRRVLEEACRRVISFDAFFLMGYDAQAHAFFGFGGHDAGLPSPPNVVPAAGTPGARVVRTRQSLLTLRADDPAAQGAQVTGTGRRSESVIRTPILSEDEVLGILSVHSYTPGLYTAADVEVVEVLASLTATAFLNVRLAEERQAAEAALRERERQLREAQRIAQLGSWRWTIGSDRVAWSDEMFRIYGLPPGDGTISLDDFMARIHPDDRALLLGTVAEVQERGGSGEFLHRIIRPDGTVRTLHARGEVVRGPGGAPYEMLGTGQDVTVLKEAEAALQRAHDELEQRVAARTAELAERTAELGRAEQRFRAIVEASPTPLLISRRDDGAILYANDRLEALLGAASGSLLGQKTPDFYFDPADRPQVVATIRAQGYARDLELRIRRVDGTPRWVSLSVQHLIFDGVPALATALLDITERKRVEATLRLQKTLLEAQDEASIDGILVVSEAGQILSCNRRFVEMWGLRPDVIAAGTREAVARAIRGQLLDPEAFFSRSDHLYAFPDEAVRDEVALRDGRVFDRYSAPVVSSEGDYYGRIWFYRDMTAQKRHAEELEQARQEAERARIEASHYAESLERELEFGRQIQQGLFPATLPQPPGWEIAVRFHPVWQVAGDFYDAFALPAGRIGLLIADVSGKGVGAALFMALFQSLLRASAERAGAAGAADAALLTEAVTATNDYITRVHRHAHMFASVFFGLLDPASGTLHYINAGHEPPVVIGPDPGVRLTPTGPALGLLAGATFTVGRTRLAPGALFLAFTDGVTEARNEARDFFTEERLLALLTPPPATAAGLLDRIEAAVHHFAGEADPFDDLTLLAVRRQAG